MTVNYLYQKCAVFIVLIFVILFFYNQNILYSISISITAPVPKIWVSMSLCWSEKSPLFGKSEYPYTYAAQLSSKLWRNVTDGEVNVLLTIVYNEDTFMDGLDDYVNTLEKEEGVIIVLEKTSSLGCVLQSQISRMFGFRNKFMNDEDIILTSDVDIFIMDKKLLDPLREPFSTWVYQYWYTGT